VISYVPADENGVPVTAEVVEGKYTVEMVPGKKRVQISAPVVVGTRKEYDGPDAPTVEVTEETLPDRYHVNTELTYEAQAGQQRKDWSLESQQRGR
jgi:hypothetical protein